MLRITEAPMENGATTLRIEGRLTHATVGELLASLDARGAVRLDLSRVCFADAAGVGAVRDALARGSTVVGCSGLLAEMLRDGRVTVGADLEAQLVTALRAGDETAFETLVRLHGGRMLAVAKRFLPGDEDARDVVQEAFLAVCRSIDRFEGGAKLSTWLHRIVVNAALMKLRSRRRRREDAIEDLLPRFDEDGHHADAIMPWEASADELVERGDTRTIVRRAIDRLPESHRTVLLLRDIEERDTDEAAALLGISAQAVKTRLHRARQALRTMLARELAPNAG
jgi:RNA polymerase sigma-70 factor, ECF subfamily